MRRWINRNLSKLIRDFSRAFQGLVKVQIYLKTEVAGENKYVSLLSGYVGEITMVRLFFLTVLSIGLYSGGAFAHVTVKSIVVQNGSSIILIKGDFEFSDDPESLVIEVAASGSKIVTFDSNGGNIASAMAFGRMIRSLGLSTVQLRSSQCVSACSLAFVGGIQRQAEPGSIGVHQSSFAPEDALDSKTAVTSVQQVTSQMMTYLIEMEVDPKLLELSLSISSEDMRYLTANEMAAFHVTTEAGFGTHTTFSIKPNLPLKIPIPIFRPSPPNENTTLDSSEDYTLPDDVTADKIPKMFLYEERLGQALPTALSGTIAWSINSDTVNLNGKKQSQIRANINVQERGLTGLVTFKCNRDKSLPASHVFEFTFSGPKDLVGGGIDTVQRISLKKTEQDRGNSLIGVSTKVTDDFYIFAMNDDPDAVVSNLELLKSRSWIDVPITYRNGRRALITFEKGVEGSEDFKKVLVECQSREPN